MGQNLILLATARTWLATALKEVIAPKGFTLAQAEDTGRLLRSAEKITPAVIIVDEELPGLEIDDTTRSLIHGPAGRHTPLLLYTASTVARGRQQAKALRAGFWDVLSEPLRPAVIVAKLQRLLAIRSDLETASSTKGQSRRRQSISSVGSLTLDELGRVLPAIGALAEREGTSISIVLLAPTEKLDDSEGGRSMTAFLCGSHLRRADLCASLDDTEVAVIAFDTDAQDARTLVERLDAVAATRGEPGGAAPHLSAAIVELDPAKGLKRAVDGAGERGTDITLDRVVKFFHLDDAREALRDAREAGGGVRVVKMA